MSIHGWIIIDKPLNMTSTDVVRAIKRKFPKTKVGHAGTLDPLATGVLPIALGEATKTIPYLSEQKKTYRFEVTWGEQTTTDDAEGDTMLTSCYRPSEEEIMAILPQFTGQISQAPPRFSAIKVAGKRAYDLARSGEDFSLPPRPAQIYTLRLLEVKSSDIAQFEVECQKGTYVRSLARDMAKALGTYGFASMIDRTAVGSFYKDTALSYETLAICDEKILKRDHVQNLIAGLDDIPAVMINEQEVEKVRCGQELHTSLLLSGELCLLCLHTAENPIAIAHIKGERILPKRVFVLN
ncbi:MAG: tRNA pseudouridine(55) synthase TruB [Caedibacter sp. 38-128]|nr:tRNA pseudouridine(55) synthase TruB [Holosporales bacterium]OJX07951.1 MAG: tRNA pseudouridine(55) synthase TruB [Caedibacter sp. 38-128]